MKSPQLPTAARSFSLFALVGMLLTGCHSSNQNPDSHERTDIAAADSKAGSSLRIGYQKGTPLHVLRVRGDLDKRLASLGVKVEWLDFPAGPQTLEALGAGSIDFSEMGDSPPIFAQAAGMPIVYVADQPTTKDAGRALIVPAGSAIRSVADLRGKRVAVQKGSGTHSFLVQALAKAGVPYKDVKVAYLAPADARAAFTSGNVDAWAIWDPFLAVAQSQMKAKVIADGSVSRTAGGFFVSSRTFAVSHADLIRIALEEADKTSVWIASHPHDAAVILSPTLRVDVPTLETVEKRAFASGTGATSLVGYRPITDELWNVQQEVADNFLSIGLLPKHVNVRDGALTVAQYAALLPVAAPAKVAAIRRSTP